MHPPKQNYQYYKEIFKTTKCPFAFVDLDFFDENIQTIKARAANKKIRVASKSVRCTKLLKRILDTDPQYQGIMAFTADEAVFLSQHGFDDILLAYPVWNKTQVAAIADEIAKGRYINLILDSKEHVMQINRVAQEKNITIPVSLDIDMSSQFPGVYFGVYRSRIKNEEQAAEMADIIESAGHLRLDGIMGYEAQIAGLGDNAPGKPFMNRVIRLLKKHSVKEVANRREAVVKKLPRLRFVNAGGSGSLETSRQEKWVTEVTVGSAFFCPTLFDAYANFSHLPAAAFALEITRQPRPDIFTCLGGGYIASGSPGFDKLPQPYLPETVHLIKDEGAGEVQTPFLHKGKELLKLGDPVFMRHAKAGELCERFNELYLVSKGEIVDKVPTYRGEGKCFL